jgi:hypothetical protein
MTKTETANNNTLGNDTTEGVALIIRDCKKARARIIKDRKKLSSEIWDLENPPPPKQPDYKKIDKFDAARTVLLKAEEKLLLDTLINLNSSTELKKLQAALDGVNSDLKAKIQNVNALAERLTGIANTIKMIDGIVSNIAKLILMPG